MHIYELCVTTCNIKESIDPYHVIIHRDIYLYNTKENPVIRCCVNDMIPYDL